MVVLLWFFVFTRERKVIGGREFKLSLEDSDVVVGNMGGTEGALRLGTLDLTGRPIPQELEASKDSSIIAERTIIIGEKKVFYRESLPQQQPPKQQVLLLHGVSFSSQTWQELGTLHYLSAMGHRAVAVDLPGYGQSEGPKGSIIDPASFVEQLISSLGLDSPVIISPSMSGGFSLPYLTAHPGKVRGFVPVAPVKTQLYADKYPSIKTPTVIVYGDGDTGLGVDSLKNLSLLPNHAVVKLANAGHAAYLNQPQVWHTILYNFLENL